MNTTPTDILALDRGAPTRPRASRRLLAIALYGLLVLLVSGVVLSQRVAAELNEKSLALGRRLDAFQGLSGKVTELSWNGQQLAVSTTTVGAPLDQVLGRFVEACGASTGMLVQELAHETGGGGAAERLFRRLLVLRDRFEDGTGTAVCLGGLGEGGLASLRARATRFARSWDLSELGQLRYTFLRRIDDTRTHVVLVSADGSLQLDKLLPLDGKDVEGEDAIAGARPARSVRFMSARAKGTPHAFTAYRSELAPQVALADYGRQLLAQGFERAVTLVKAVEQLPTLDARHVLSEAYRRGDELFVVASQRHEHGSLLSVVRVGAIAIEGPYEQVAHTASRAAGATE